MAADILRTRLLLALLLLSALCIHSCCASSYSHSRIVISSLSPQQSVTTASAHRLPATLQSSTSQPTPTPTAPSIYSVSGCVHDTANGTSDCNVTSVLTVAGDDFDNATAIDIAGQVRCNLSDDAVQSSTRLVTAVCPYYYPQDTSYDLRVIGSGNTSSAPLVSAISFHGTAPYILSVNSSSCNVPPLNGCDPSRNNYLTVYGRNFLSSPAPQVRLYIWLITQYMACRTMQITFNRFVCMLPAFRWPGAVPSPSTKFGVLAVVLNANWLREDVQSNFVAAVISFKSPTSDSSSTGVQPPSFLPNVQRVSGCEDSFVGTRNCPYPYNSPITLRLVGNRFTPFIGSLSVWINDQPCPILEPVHRDSVECSWDTNAVDWATVGTTPMTVSLNSSAGWVNTSSAVSVNTVFANPTIESVSGCPLSTYEQPKTAGCDRSRTLTLYGDAFARYLPASLIIAYSTTVDCVFPITNPLTIECSLASAVLNGVVRSVYVPVQLRLGERTSEPVPYVSFAPDNVPPVESSSSAAAAGGDSDGPSADELVGMKLALLSMMIISLIVLVVALGVWMTGWWLAHRRSYVSQHGQAAVDARQVLLQ